MLIKHYYGHDIHDYTINLATANQHHNNYSSFHWQYSPQLLHIIILEMLHWKFILINWLNTLKKKNKEDLKTRS